VAVPAEYPTLVLFTSGTTAAPKLALQGHAGFQVAVLDAWRAIIEIGPGRVMQPLLNLAFGPAFSIYTSALLLGTRVVIAEQDPRTAEEFESMARREGADRGITSPAVFARMQGTSELEFQFALIGERMSAARWRQIFAMFPRLRVRNGFGANEVGLLTCGDWFDSSGNADAFNASAALPWVEHEVVDPNDAGEGKLCVRTSLPTICRGFLNDADGFQARLRDEGALFETGDVVRDGGRSFAMVGRSDNLLKIRSRFLDPAIVEQSCVAIDGVDDAKLIAHDGDAHLFLVGDPAAVDTASLADNLVERAGAHARPASVQFVDGFERTPSGKIKEGALRALLP
jgi:acyl-coenzyme A synthetase/AMP-(fatty) acid ligase